MFQDLQSAVFSELIEQNIDAECSFSPNGLNFACALQCQIFLWDVELKEIVQKFICDGPIDYLKWSPDSELICCIILKQNTIQVWNLASPLWRCKINENPLSIAEVHWAPDSLHLLVVTEFYLKLTVWSLVSSTIAVIENPKSIKNFISFSPCDRYLAVAQRRKCEDYISIYTCDTWEILKIFPVETKDFSRIYFSPSNLVVGVLETFTEEPKAVFYSVDGRIVGKYTRPGIFGFMSFSWSSDGNWIALGDYFGKVTILHSSNYEAIISYQEPECIESENVVIYRVEQKSMEKMKPLSSGDASSNWELYEVVKERPIAFASLLNLSERTKSKQAKYGIQVMQFSHCGQYLASLNGSLPKVILIFDTSTFALSSIIVHQYQIKDLSWHPTKPILTVCSGSGSVDLWTPSGCISIMSPFKGGFLVASGKWSSRKDCLILNGKDHFSVLYLPDFSTIDSVIDIGNTM